MRSGKGKPWNFTRRGFLAGFGTGALTIGFWNRSTTSSSALMSDHVSRGLFLNDASELSLTPVWKNLTTQDVPMPLDSFISATIASAAAEGRCVIGSAARHSMGGQSLAKEGLTITMDDERIQIDETTMRYCVSGGTRWKAVISALDARGYSPAVMQSNNDFGVAATFCVNAHGWPVPYSGCGSTVRSVDMILANGRKIRASREEEPELFKAAMGGYGLFGIITSLELDMVKNKRLVPTFERVSGDAFGPRFSNIIKSDNHVVMAYGRLDVTHDHFFENALAVTYRPTSDQDTLPVVVGSGIMSKVSRPIFRSQVDNERMKKARWWMETEIGPRLGNGHATRNTLLNEPVITLDDQDPTRTDILHEYFISPSRLHEFLKVCKDVIPNSYQQLLNITLRFVSADRESLLSYAPEDRISAVMLFSQEKSARAEADMVRMTRLLVDGALSSGGSYYLPYRLHATQEQFEAAYPRTHEFIALKKKFDPEERFSNGLWTTYLKGLT